MARDIEERAAAVKGDCIAPIVAGPLRDAADAHSPAYHKELAMIMMRDRWPDLNRQGTLWAFENVVGWVSNADAAIAALQRSASERQRA